MALSPGVFAFDPDGPKSKKKRTIEVHRFDALGVAFEIDGPHVSGITLYPAVNNP
jgi:hypothetical protein